jgi:tetratricopeptide (TPR) repeat protein
VVIEAGPGATTTVAPDFPTLFRQYIVNSVQATLAAISQDDALLTAETRDRALHVLSFALKRADGWTSTRALLLLLAPKLEQAGHRDDWLPYLEAGVTLSQACADPGAEAELSLAISQLHRLVSRFAPARMWLTASSQTFATLGNYQGQARALNQLAYVAWQQHEYPAAERLADNALALLDKTDPERAMSLSALGLVALDRQQWVEAERYHRDALQIRTVQGDRRKIAWSMQNLGYALRGQGRYTEAITCFEQAITILEEIHDLANCAIAQMNLGIVYWYDAEPAKALEKYTLAEHTFTKLSDMHNLAKIFTNKGLGYMNLGDWVQAEKAFMASIALHQKVGDVSFRLDASDGLGLVYLGQGQYDKAIATFESALAELPQITGTPMYDYLMKVLPDHLAQARQKNEAPREEPRY